ncbi:MULTISPECIES: thioredoxin family protein [unclassified Pseudomonas]|uniref:thioredoxin family protein n=1 Tax=unclassified Pseudomonas TaxID=196821 RepID=UPI0025F769BF|nr:MULTISPECIES: thioredoxin family protein [unclassified Pseudomonas]
MDQLQLTDFDLDRQLLNLPGISLLIFTSVGCSSCRWARQQLPVLALPVQRLCWVDAEENGGAVQRYGVFHLPTLFVVRDGQFHGALRCKLSADAMTQALDQALALAPDDLP